MKHHVLVNFHIGGIVLSTLNTHTGRWLIVFGWLSMQCVNSMYYALAAFKVGMPGHYSRIPCPQVFKEFVCVTINECWPWMCICCRETESFLFQTVLPETCLIFKSYLTLITLKCIKWRYFIIVILIFCWWKFYLVGCIQQLNNHWKAYANSFCLK